MERETAVVRVAVPEPVTIVEQMRYVDAAVVSDEAIEITLDLERGDSIESLRSGMVRVTQDAMQTVIPNAEIAGVSDQEYADFEAIE